MKLEAGIQSTSREKGISSKTIKTQTNDKKTGELSGDLSHRPPLIEWCPVTEGWQGKLLLFQIETERSFSTTVSIGNRQQKIGLERLFRKLLEMI
jgi:hypothetical protein